MPPESVRLTHPHVAAPAALPDDIERLALIGWAMYPVLTRHRAACFEGAHLQATHDLDQLAAWAREFPRCGWRVHLGRSGIWTIDIDAKGEDHAADGKASLDKLLAKGHRFPRLPDGRPAFPMMRSGGGGWWCVWSHAGGEDLRGQPRRDLPGIDPLRGDQSMTVPPSPHIRTGTPYRWIVAPWDVAPPPAPDWLLALYRRPPPPKPRVVVRDIGSDRAEGLLLEAECKIACAAEGNRNNTINRQAFIVGRCIADGLLPPAYARDRLYNAALLIGEDARKAISTIDGAFQRAAKLPKRR